MSKVYVVAILKCKADDFNLVGEKFAGIMSLVRAEDGCIRYDLHKDFEGKPEFMLYETWESMEALEAHLKTDHMVKFFGEAKPLLSEEPMISTWKFEA